MQGVGCKSTITRLGRFHSHDWQCTRGRVGLPSIAYVWSLSIQTRGRILERDWDKVFLLAIHSHLYLPPPPQKKWFETGLQCKHWREILKSENSQNYAQKTQRNCTFMNCASALQLCGKAKYFSFNVSTRKDNLTVKYIFITKIRKCRDYYAGILEQSTYGS